MARNQRGPGLRDLPQLLFELSRRPPPPAALARAGAEAIAQAQAHAARRLRVAVALKKMADGTEAAKVALVQAGALPVLRRVIEEGDAEACEAAARRSSAGGAAGAGRCDNALAWSKSSASADSAAAAAGVADEGGQDIAGHMEGSSCARVRIPQCAVSAVLAAPPSTSPLVSSGPALQLAVLTAVWYMTRARAVLRPMLVCGLVSPLVLVAATDRDGGRLRALNALGNMLLLARNAVDFVLSPSLNLQVQQGEGGRSEAAVVAAAAVESAPETASPISAARGEGGGAGAGVGVLVLLRLVHVLPAGEARTKALKALHNVTLAPHARPALLALRLRPRPSTIAPQHATSTSTHMQLRLAFGAGQNRTVCGPVETVVEAQAGIGAGEGAEVGGESGVGIVETLVQCVARDRGGARLEALRALNNIALLRAGGAAHCGGEEAATSAALSLAEQLAATDAVGVLGRVLRDGAEMFATSAVTSNSVAGLGVGLGASAGSLASDSTVVDHEEAALVLSTLTNASACVASLEQSTVSSAVAESGAARITLLPVGPNLHARHRHQMNRQRSRASRTRLARNRRQMHTQSKQASISAAPALPQSLPQGTLQFSNALVQIGILDSLILLLRQAPSPAQARARAHALFMRKSQFAHVAIPSPRPPPNGHSVADELPSTPGTQAQTLEAETLNSGAFRNGRDCSLWPAAGAQSRALTLLLRLAEDSAAAITCALHSHCGVGSAVSSAGCSSTSGRVFSSGGWLRSQIGQTGIPDGFNGDTALANSSAEYEMAGVGSSLRGRLDRAGAWGAAAALLQEDTTETGSSTTGAATAAMARQQLKAAFLATFLGAGICRRGAENKQDSGLAASEALLRARAAPPRRWILAILGSLRSRLRDRGAKDAIDAAGSIQLPTHSFVLALRCLAPSGCLWKSAKERCSVFCLLLQLLAYATDGRELDAHTLEHALDAMLHVLPVPTPAWLTAPALGAVALLARAIAVAPTMGSRSSAALLLRLFERSVERPPSASLPWCWLGDTSRTSAVGVSAFCGASVEATFATASDSIDASSCQPRSSVSHDICSARRRLAATLADAGLRVVVLDIGDGVADTEDDTDGLDMLSCEPDALVIEVSTAAAASSWCRLVAKHLTVGASWCDVDDPHLRTNVRRKPSSSAQSDAGEQEDDTTCDESGSSSDDECVARHRRPPLPVLFADIEVGYEPGQGWLHDMLTCQQQHERRQWQLARSHRQRQRRFSQQRRQQQRQRQHATRSKGDTTGAEDESGTSSADAAGISGGTDGDTDESEDCIFVSRADCSALVTDADVSAAIAELATAVKKRIRRCAKAKATTASDTTMTDDAGGCIDHEQNDSIGDPGLDAAPDSEAISAITNADNTVHRQIAGMSSDDVMQWLSAVGLEECRVPLQNARVDGDALLQLGSLLDGASFETFSAYVSTPPPIGLGVSAAGHVLKLTWQLRRLLRTGPSQLMRTSSGLMDDTVPASISSSIVVPSTAGTTGTADIASARVLEGCGADAGAGDHGAEMLVALERRAAIAEAERDTIRHEFEALRCSTDKDIECSVCNKLFSTPRALAAHCAATGHGTEESPPAARSSVTDSAHATSMSPGIAVRWARGPGAGRGFEHDQSGSHAAKGDGSSRG